MQLVEAFYMPKVKTERKELLRLKKEYEDMVDSQKSYEMEDGKIWSDATDEQKAAYARISETLLVT